MENLTHIKDPAQIAKMGLNAQIEKLREHSALLKNQSQALESALIENRKEISNLVALEIGRTNAMIENLCLMVEAL